MSCSRSEDDAEEYAGDGDDPLIPESALRGIEDIEKGSIASKEDFNSALNF